MKLHAIFHKNVLDMCFLRFFEEYGDSFSRGDDGTYIFSSRASESSLEKKFSLYFKEAVSGLVPEYTESGRDFLIVIGSCYPADNILLKNSTGGVFPARLRSAIASKPEIKFVLKEKDIKIDLGMFNSLSENVFNSLFRKSDPFGRGNAFLVKNRSLDSYSVFKILKWEYGAKVRNLPKDRNLGDARCVSEINDAVDKYSRGKTEILRSVFSSPVGGEVIQYVRRMVNAR